MKSTIIASAFVAIALPALAQEDFDTGEINLGLQQRGVNTISSKFYEYRDIPQGATTEFFRFHGKKGGFRYDLLGTDVTQKDQQLAGRVEGSNWKLRADYTGIPHAFGNGGKSILNIVEPNVWRIGDTLQSFYQAQIVPARTRIDYNCQPRSGYNPPANCFSLFALVSPTLDAHPGDIDIKLQRDRTNLALSFFPKEGRFGLDLTYFHERRSGARTNNGTAFGFGNVVETWDPIRYVTQDIGVNGTLRGDWGVAFAGFNYNDFSDKYSTFLWENPFRITDSNDASAYQSPGTASVNGPAYAIAPTPPSNKAWTMKGGTTLKLGPKTRLTADLAFGQWTQNEPFIPYTTNTSITTPDGQNAATAALPASSLDGKIDTLALNGFFTTRLTDALRLNARFRHYKNDNKTPRIRFEEGYVRFDAVWEEIPRITVPNGFDSNLFDAYATYDLGKQLGLEVGYKHNKISRTFRETEHTSENTVRVAADLRPGGGFTARGVYEHGKRDFDAYHPIEAEEHSFLEEGAEPANATALRRFDQAKRDRDRIGAQVQLSPGSGKLTVGASYFWNKDKYDDSQVPCGFVPSAAADRALCPTADSPTEVLGLMEATYKTFSLDADFSPTSRATLYAFYSREDIFDYQTGRQSGATINFTPALNWSSQVDDKVDSIGVGADLTLKPERWFLNLSYRYQKVNGNNDLTAGAAARPPTVGPVEDIPQYDDTEINHLEGSLRYQIAKAWSASLGGFWEKYKYSDSQTGQVLYYMPASFFLNPVNGDYRGWVAFVNLMYKF
jgi:MtrB/PioB family decaheme-associated outer membrane protein